MIDNKTPDKSWDQRISCLGGGITQSSSWGFFQKALGCKVYFEYGTNWAYLATFRNAKAINYLLVNYGPNASGKAALDEAVNSLLAKARNLRVDFVRLEPVCPVPVGDLLLKYAAKKVTEVDPEHSQIIDLTLDEQQLRADLHSGHRNLINGTKRRGIDVYISDRKKDLEEFIKMLDDTAKRARIKFYPASFYRKLLETLGPVGTAKLYMARVGEARVAGAIFYDFNGTRYYAHAGAYQQINREVKASVSLVWQAIIDAKEAGMKKFDLWGIVPSDKPNHPWAGISKFKKAFGGQQIEYLGTWDIPINQLKYKAYNLYSKIRARQW
ncbi:MAG: peptidoglycan bridge formation glycyltransferase FemA/FemB family protein [bacterium]|nr:peptidoglycan bridge formation glycyltransferase FemA/FemB family protein [bacterium]